MWEDERAENLKRGGSSSWQHVPAHGEGWECACRVWGQVLDASGFHKAVKHTNPFILSVCLLIRALIFSLLLKWKIGEKYDVFHYLRA